MAFSSAILGSHCVRALQVRADTPIITIGHDRFTRTDLALVECTNFIAAARLSAVIAALNVKDTRDLWAHIEPEQLAVPHIGNFAFAVLEACFLAKKLGTLAQWVERSRAKDERVTTLHTMKATIARETTATTRAARTKRRRSAQGAVARAADQ